MVEYNNKRTGPYTSPTGEFLQFLPLKTYSNASKQIHNAAVRQKSTTYLPSTAPAEVRKGYAAEMKVLNANLLSAKSAALELIWADGVMVLGLQHPYSRGSVETNSGNVFDGVRADSGFLRNPLDVKLLIEGVRYARKLAATAAVQTLQPLEILPGASVTSDDALEQFIRSNTATFFHPAGSCKMGARELGGVVDTDLRVYGINGLRIVDASVIPILPATHLMTTVYAIAEKVRDYR
jgi:choline dehydrogenase-like flavoprotein